MPCPCFPDCGCALEAGDLILIEGSGNLLDPWIVSGIETVFSATGTNGITVTPGGDYGHEPTIEILVDPAGTAPVSVGPDGLKVDCCDVAIASILDVSDTSTVDLTLAGDTLSADVIISPDLCNSLEDRGNGLFSYRGERWVDVVGGALRTIPTTGDSASDSWSHTIQNTNDCTIYVEVSGTAVTNSEIDDPAQNVNFDASCRLESTVAFVDGSNTRSVRINEMTNTGSLNPFPSGEGITTSDFLFGTIRLPAGNSTTVRMYMNSTNFVNLIGGGGGGLGFQFRDVAIRMVQNDQSLDLNFDGAAV